MSSQTDHMSTEQNYKGPILAGFSAIIIGLGLNRFSYVAFIPILVAENWVSPVQAGYLGAANLLGYLIGAVSANWTATRYGVAASVRFNLVLSILSFMACAWPAGIEWLTVWRLIAGVTGAQLMVIAVPAVLSQIPLAGKGRASGLVFSGIGVGIIFSGYALPRLAELGISETWLALAVLCAVFSIFAWRGWPGKAVATNATNAPSADKILTLPVLFLLLAYALDAVGFVPHTVYWVDYVARALGLGSRIGGYFWMILGLGAVFGPIAAGWCADKIGFKFSLMIALALKTAAVALPLISTDYLSLTISSFIVGAMTPGMVALVSGYTALLVGPQRNRQVWGWMTFSFATAQAGSGYFMAWLFGTTSSYIPLFWAGSLALLAGLILVSVSPRPSDQKQAV